MCTYIVIPADSRQFQVTSWWQDHITQCIEPVIQVDFAAANYHIISHGRYSDKVWSLLYIPKTIFANDKLSLVHAFSWFLIPACAVLNSVHQQTIWCKPRWPVMTWPNSWYHAWSARDARPPADDNQSQRGNRIASQKCSGRTRGQSIYGECLLNILIRELSVKVGFSINTLLDARIMFQ